MLAVAFVRGRKVFATRIGVTRDTARQHEQIEKRMYGQSANSFYVFLLFFPVSENMYVRDRSCLLLCSLLLKARAQN